jgi:hypothetical protein
MFKCLFFLTALLSTIPSFAELTAEQKSKIIMTVMEPGYGKDYIHAMFSSLSCDGKSLLEAGIDAVKMKELIELGQPALDNPCLSIDVVMANTRTKQVMNARIKELRRKFYENERREREPNYGSDGSGWSPANERAKIEYLGQWVTSGPRGKRGR